MSGRLATSAAWLSALFLSSAMFSHDVALRLILLFAGAACAIVVALKNRPSVRLLPPIWLPFVLWGGWAAMSLAWSEEPARSLKELHNEVGYTGLAAILCYIGAQASAASRIVLPVLGASAALLCGVAFHHYLFSPDLFAEGWHGGPGHLSSTLLTLLPGSVAVGWYAARHAAKGVVLWLSAALCLLILAAAYTTLNRTVWVAFTVQLAVIVVLLMLRPGSQRSGWTVRSAAGLTAIIAAGVVMTAYVHGEREQGATAVPLSKDPRIAVWSEALDRIAERPLTGYGFGRGLLRRSLRHETGDSMLWHSHNLFLDTLLQTGVPGLVLLLLLLGATIREGWKLSRDANDAAAVAGIALIAIVCGMVIRNMTDLLFLRHNALLYWGSAGLLLGWGSVCRSGSPR